MQPLSDQHAGPRAGPRDIASRRSDRPVAPDRPAILWFRRDLRLHDHPALIRAVEGHATVVPVFVFDAVLLGERLSAPNRRWHMLEAVRVLAEGLAARGAPLVVRRGDPVELIPRLATEIGAREVHVSRDLAPYGRARDARVSEALHGIGAVLHEAPGVAIHEPERVASREGRPFMAFGPFRRAWERLPPRDPLPAPWRIRSPERGLDGRPIDPGVLPELEAIGAVPTADRVLLLEPGEPAARARLEAWLARDDEGLDGYADRRGRLDLDGSSRLSADLRWGTVSAAEVLVRASRPGSGAASFAAELCWRDFYAHVLWHRPELRRAPFVAALADVRWRDDPAGVDAWRAGLTGYPVVDAAMRQLAASGWLNDRARMIVASFLVKDLLVDWRVGERHFMEHLVDGDVASNVGGWQWIASTGPDAQPAFRILNPVLQGRRFDPDGRFVRRWIPELAGVPTPLVHEPWRMTAEEQRRAACAIGSDYPAPIVDHAEARVRAIEAYRAAR